MTALPNAPTDVPDRHTAPVAVIGGGLAGSEAALQLARRGIRVDLYEMKPKQKSPAHHNSHCAEIVCSNSFGNLKTATASGLIKAELMALGCQLIATAHRLAVPAGNALAVDREAFAADVTRQLEAEPNITLVCDEVQTLPTRAYQYVIVATGPLTTPGLINSLQTLLKQEQLYFFDAAAPILTRDSIDFNIAFYQDRYNQSQSDSEAASYINCPMSQPEYEALIAFINQAEKIQSKAFEQEAAGATQFFESCLPIEVLASRGLDTPRFGPMKPVGITDPRTGQTPWAVVQLRQDNAEGSLYNIVGFQTNLKWGEQKAMIELIPGLGQAEVVRYGVMHRNTFINSPECLNPSMQLRAASNVLVAGQLTGVEGYTESIAAGLIAATSVYQLLQQPDAGPVLLPPESTMIGALLRYITRKPVTRFQPINSNWGILPELSAEDWTLFSEEGKRPKKKNKVARNATYAQRALSQLQQFIGAHATQLGLDATEPVSADAGKQPVVQL
ncbi:MAG: methylenetetrahydrofolate--tRNA-(uracil(54)-C(5))-methyltransferase (FADH(2)-oxidizing) TrmFO [Cyanobacteria bacterium HKST-UBA05]|nr:methylenetetrahydrofolate--tRNA-(uracil(54)-C(5))-methyltransferase (FADH(2)-oxidizing) TrmFO [Cyanobacteria bacterium HKST-UBA05]